jgi:hypothetical protein
MEWFLTGTDALVDQLMMLAHSVKKRINNRYRVGHW